MTYLTHASVEELLQHLPEGITLSSLSYAGVFILGTHVWLLTNL